MTTLHLHSIRRKLKSLHLTMEKFKNPSYSTFLLASMPEILSKADCTTPDEENGVKALK